MALLDVNYDSASKLWLFAGFGLALYVITSSLISAFSAQARFWRAQAWAGQQKGWFPRFRSGWKAIKGTKDMLDEAYWKHSKENRPFAMPIFAQEPHLMLPQSMTKDFLQELEENINLLVVD